MPQRRYVSSWRHCSVVCDSAWQRPHCLNMLRLWARVTVTRLPNMKVGPRRMAASLVLDSMLRIMLTAALVRDGSSRTARDHQGPSMRRVPLKATLCTTSRWNPLDGAMLKVESKCLRRSGEYLSTREVGG